MHRWRLRLGDSTPKYLARLIMAFLLLLTIDASADDVGITKVRLIQASEKTYLLEADVTQALSWAIKAPIFPDRF